MKIKRPLAAAALAVCILSFIFARFFPQVLMPAFITENEGALEDESEITLSGRVYKVQEKTYSMYVYLRCTKAALSGGKFQNAGEVLLIISKEDYEALNIKPGNKILADCSVLEFDKARNNGNYDEENYYKSLGIFLKVSADSVKITSGFVNWPSWLMARLKERIIDSIDEIVSDKSSAIKGIFIALLTGDKTYLTDGTKDLYSENGIFHILAVSGLHISIIGMGLFSFLKKYIGPYKSGALAAAAMLLYCVLCGLSVSALRATIMFIVRIFAYYTGKTFDLLSALGLSCILILLSNPFYILNSGFALSFTAILGIGVANKNLEEFLRPKRKISKGLLSSGCISIISLPLVANLYYTVPLYAVLLNLIVIPLMSIVLSSALAGGIAGIFSSLLGRFFIGLGFYTVYFINFCCYLASLLWMSSIVTGCLKTLKVLLFYCALCAFLFFARQKNLKEREPQKPPENKNNNCRKLSQKAKRWALFFTLLALLILIVFVNPSNGSLRIIMFDVDQGDGILIITPENLVILIDGGSTTEDELWEYRLESALEYEGISKIDYSIITHPDSDHTSGILDLLNDAVTPVYIENLLIPYVEENENYKELISAAEDAGVNVINISKGMTISSGSVLLSCLHPEEGAVYEDANDYSAVFSLVWGDFTALFTGDISSDIELGLIESQSLPENITLLKVAHHGSKYSTCSEFLSTVSPQIAIISAGVDNSYGHPSDETLSRLEETGADVYVTSDVGEIKITVSKEGNIDIWTKF